MQFKSIKHLSFFALVTVGILLIPFVAMRFTSEVNWTISDFIFAGVLLFGSGLVYELATRNMENRQHRVIVGLIVLAALVFIWGGAATGT